MQRFRWTNWLAMLLLLGASLGFSGCEDDKNADIPDNAKTVEKEEESENGPAEKSAKTEDEVIEETQQELMDQYADQAKEEISKDNASSRADELAEEIEADMAELEKSPSEGQK